jgi:hypothetical protein
MNTIAKAIGITTIAIFIASCGLAFIPQKLYEGADMPDHQTAAISGGFVTDFEGEQWSAILVGVDGKLCPAGFLAKDNGPVPKHFCGNASIVQPGVRDLSFIIQSVNRISLSSTSTSTNSWKRVNTAIVAKGILLEPGTVYASQPRASGGQWVVDVKAVCKSSNHRDSVMAVATNRPCT